MKIKAKVHCCLFTAIGLMSIINADAQSKMDSMAVEKACRDYVEGWIEGNGNRIDQGVSVNLVKRTINENEEGESYVRGGLGSSALISASRKNKGKPINKDLHPDDKFNLEVVIYDITGKFALVKTTTRKYGFFDYCQLAKYNGEWKIFNVLWGYLPQ